MTQQAMMQQEEVLLKEKALLKEVGNALEDGLLSVAEHSFCSQLLQLFTEVSARQPKKGLLSLLKKAAQLQTRHSSAYNAVLVQLLQEATLRSKARIKLLNACPMASKSE